MLAVKRAHVTMLPLAPFASKETPILLEEVVRETVNALVTQLIAHQLRRRWTAHLAMRTRTHALMEHAQVSRDDIDNQCGIEDP